MLRAAGGRTAAYPKLYRLHKTATEAGALRYSGE